MLLFDSMGLVLSSHWLLLLFILSVFEHFSTFQVANRSEDAVNTNSEEDEQADQDKGNQAPEHNHPASKSFVILIHF